MKSIIVTAPLRHEQRPDFVWFGGQIMPDTNNTRLRRLLAKSERADRVWAKVESAGLLAGIRALLWGGL